MIRAPASPAAPRRRAQRAGAPGAEVARLACTGATVRRLARRLTAFYEHHLRAVGVTLPQYSLLAHLSDRPQSLRALALCLETDRTTLTRNLAPLQARGWVAQTAGADARQRLLVLTPAGRSARREARAIWKKAQAALEDTLGPPLVAQLHARLDEALARLKPALPDDN